MKNSKRIKSLRNSERPNWFVINEDIELTIIADENNDFIVDAHFCEKDYTEEDVSEIAKELIDIVFDYYSNLEKKEIDEERN